MIGKRDLTLFWFRRDLRLEDNAGLYHALKNNKNVLVLFIFDTDILDRLENKEDKRVEFIHSALLKLQEQLIRAGSSLLVLHGCPAELIMKLTEKYSVKNLYCNHDYEPDTIERDKKIKELLSKKGIGFFSSKDQVVFDRSEIIKDDGTPYSIYTPYMRKWKSKLNDFYLNPYPSEKLFKNLFKTGPFTIPSLKKIGFRTTTSHFANPIFNEELISNYHESRNFPFIEGTSRLSLHLRYGTISIRQLAKKALKLNDQWLNELIWREFYMMILFHFPHVVKGAFKKQYDAIPWMNDEGLFDKWCKGETGYPIVDAGMRELNATGFMHNRVRMIAAGFLVKHLMIDWRWGEAYFAEKLTDFDLAANNGGWQWAAGSGCDAAPYFRIFNPVEQTKRFDPEFNYIRKWVPEFEELTYPKPVVDHKFARARVLATYKKTLAKNFNPVNKSPVF